MIGMYKNVLENIIRIVKCLKEAEEGWIWVREIARRCDIHHKTVSRLLDAHLSNFIEVQTVEPFNIRMIRLKKDADVNSVLRYLATKQRIDDIQAKIGRTAKPATQK